MFSLSKGFSLPCTKTRLNRESNLGWRGDPIRTNALEWCSIVFAHGFVLLASVSMWRSEDRQQLGTWPNVDYWRIHKHCSLGTNISAVPKRWRKKKDSFQWYWFFHVMRPWLFWAPLELVMVRTSPSQGAESSPPPQPSVMESQMAFLYHSPVTNGNSSFCGASLISDIQLVTAAHCVAGKTTDEVAVLIGNPNTEVELNKQIFLLHLQNWNIQVRPRDNWRCLSWYFRHHSRRASSS